MSRHIGGNCCGFLAFALDAWNVIYLHLPAFNCKLFSSAHFCTCCTFSSLMWLLMAGMTKYMSSACLTSSLLGCIGHRSAALTTYEAGPRPEPWMASCIYCCCIFFQLHHITTATLVWLYSRTDLNRMFLPVVVALLAFSCYRPLIIEYGLLSALKVS